MDMKKAREEYEASEEKHVGLEPQLPMEEAKEKGDIEVFEEGDEDNV